MSNDLISRKALKEWIEEKNYCLFNDTQEQIINSIIDQQPTAYDLDKVLIKLESEKETNEDECGFNEFDYIDYETAMDIVREGGA